MGFENKTSIQILDLSFPSCVILASVFSFLKQNYNIYFPGLVCLSLVRLKRDFSMGMFHKERN